MVKAGAYEKRDIPHEADDGPALICREALVTSRYHYWLGASGARYLHSVYSLRECPALPKATYILVRRDPDGVRWPLKVGLTVEEAHSLNLAHLRFEGARRGANEVHIHLLAENAEEREAVATDLKARQTGVTSCSRPFSPDNDSTAA
jgi:hypothetical protein